MGAPWKLDTLEKLRDAGYHYEERGACLSSTCSTVIFWFITPKGKWMPFEMLPTTNIDEPVRYQPHFSSCPDARHFSRKSKDVVERKP